MDPQICLYCISLLAVNYLDNSLLPCNFNPNNIIFNTISSTNKNLYHFQDNFIFITLFDPHKNTFEDWEDTVSLEL